MTVLLTVDDPSPAATVGLPLGSLHRYTAALTVVVLLVVAGRAEWQRRGEPVTHLFPGLGALALVAAAALTAGTQSAWAADAWPPGFSAMSMRGVLRPVIVAATSTGGRRRR